jgi:hypothetical protein
VGLIGAIIDIHKKAQAGVLIEEMLKRHSTDEWFAEDPSAYANLLVRNAWKFNSHVFDGKSQKRPTATTTAAFAFARHAECLSDTDTDRMVLVLCVSTLLSRLEKEAVQFKLNDTDRLLIDYCVEFLKKEGKSLGVALAGGA